MDLETLDDGQAYACAALFVLSIYSVAVESGAHLHGESAAPGAAWGTRFEDITAAYCESSTSSHSGWGWAIVCPGGICGRVFAALGIKDASAVGLVTLPDSVHPLATDAQKSEFMHLVASYVSHLDADTVFTVEAASSALASASRDFTDGPGVTAKLRADSPVPEIQPLPPTKEDEERMFGKVAEAAAAEAEADGSDGQGALAVSVSREEMEKQEEEALRTALVTLNSNPVAMERIQRHNRALEGAKITEGTVLPEPSFHPAKLYMHKPSSQCIHGVQAILAGAVRSPFPTVLEAGEPRWYDARARSACMRLAHWLSIPAPTMNALEVMQLSGAGPLTNIKVDEGELHAYHKSRRKWAAVGAAGVGGGVLTALTAGLAAPGIVAGIGSMVGLTGSTGAAAAISGAAGSAASVGLVSGGSGAAGAAYYAAKMARRVADVSEFGFVRLEDWDEHVRATAAAPASPEPSLAEPQPSAPNGSLDAPQPQPSGSVDDAADPLPATPTLPPPPPAAVSGPAGLPGEDGATAGKDEHVPSPLGTANGTAAAAAPSPPQQLQRSSLEKATSSASAGGAAASPTPSAVTSVATGGTPTHTPTALQRQQENGRKMGLTSPDAGTGADGEGAEKAPTTARLGWRWFRTWSRRDTPPPVSARTIEQAHVASQGTFGPLASPVPIPQGRVAGGGLLVAVNGWLAERSDFVTPFAKLDRRKGDTLALVWESQVLIDISRAFMRLLARSAGQQAIQLALYATASGLATATMWPVAVINCASFIDSAWDVAATRAERGGKLLAKMLMVRLHGDRPVTLLGVSMGARLVFHCLLELFKLGGQGVVENVVMLGAPVSLDRGKLSNARSVVSGRFVNGYSITDWVLALCCRAKVGQGALRKPAGNGPVEVVGIEDMDFSGVVQGHGDWCKHMDKILPVLGLEGDHDIAA